MKPIKYLILLLYPLIFQSCTKNTNDISNNTGTGGSMARFTVMGNFLYALDYGKLHIYNVTNPASPAFVKSVEIGSEMETIFPYQNTLLLGSRNGMYIYEQDGSTGHVGEPTTISHFHSCDPVVAENGYAYVTLRTTGPCGNVESTLQVYNIQDIKNPTLVGSTQLYAPYGLGVDGQWLFVCDYGLQIYDISDPANPVLHHSIDNIPEAYDVIPMDGTLLVIDKHNIYQYNYQDIDNITLLSTTHYGA